LFLMASWYAICFKAFVVSLKNCFSIITLYSTDWSSKGLGKTAFLLSRPSTHTHTPVCHYFLHLLLSSLLTLTLAH
jgi:hypothetical protein